MTRLFNDPADFADELTDGFVAAHRRWVPRVPGGVVRATRWPTPTVAVIIGGGSGHYPAFAGYVGQGMAHGAAMGNLFASPSAQQVYSVAKRGRPRRPGCCSATATTPATCCTSPRPQDRLNDEGIATRTVAVTDDISSAPLDEVGKRRGIAGDLAVLKIGRAPPPRPARPGPRSQPWRIGPTTAPARTASRSPAARCPARAAPLFEVPPGRMALGPGHPRRARHRRDRHAHRRRAGRDSGRPAARRAARRHRQRRAAPGSASSSTGWARSSTRSCSWSTARSPSCSRRPASQIVEPEVGELVTSFDMAGLSLTLFWLDDELERLWAAPADTPAFRKGNTRRRRGRRRQQHRGRRDHHRRRHRRVPRRRPPAWPPRSPRSATTIDEQRRRARPDRRGGRRRRPRHRHATRRHRRRRRRRGRRGARGRRRHRARARRRCLGRPGRRHLGRVVGAHPAHPRRPDRRRPRRRRPATWPPPCNAPPRR